jgi:hypothetical protein
VSYAERGVEGLRRQRRAQPEARPPRFAAAGLQFVLMRTSQLVGSRPALCCHCDRSHAELAVSIVVERATGTRIGITSRPDPTSSPPLAPVSRRVRSEPSSRLTRSRETAGTTAAGGQLDLPFIGAQSENADATSDAVDSEPASFTIHSTRERLARVPGRAADRRVPARRGERTRAVKRCAIYARYSSDLQSPTSIEDQEHLCRASRPVSVGPSQSSA